MSANKVEIAGANKTLSNLGATIINTSLISDTDSTDDLGSSSKYWANGYIDKIYLNSTASLDGSSAGVIDAEAIIRPTSDLGYSLGDTTHYWGNIYSANFLSKTSNPRFLFLNTDAPALTSGIVTEVGCQIIDIGTNYSILSTQDTTYFGGLLRIDARDASTTELMSLFIQSKTGVYTQLFKIGQTGDVAISGNLTSFTANSNLSIVPNGTGYTIIGDAGTTSHSFNTNDDLLISGRCEINGILYVDAADATMEMVSTVTGGTAGFAMREQTNEAAVITSRHNFDQFTIASTSRSGRQIILCGDIHYKDFDHTTPTNPTVYIQSATDPDTNNTQWLSLTHDQTDGVIAVGTGNVRFDSSILMAENSIKLDALLSTDEKWSGITIPGVLGATLAVGDLVYLNADDGRWELVDANLSDGYDKQLGIVLLAGNDASTSEILVYGKVRSAAFPAFTVGSPLYISETAGDMTHTQPTTADVAIRVLGFALTAEDMLFNPSNDYIVHT